MLKLDHHGHCLNSVPENTPSFSRNLKTATSPIKVFSVN